MTSAIGLLQTTAAWVWEASWQGTLVAGLVMTAQWMFRRQLSARWRNALWFLVFARLLMPALPRAEFSAYNWLPQKAAVAVAEVAVRAPEGGAHSRQSAAAPRGMEQPGYRPPAIPAPGGIAGRAAESRPIPLLPAGWAAGVLAMLGSGLAGYCRMQRRVMRMRQSVPKSLREAFAAARARVRVRRAELIISEAVATPMVSGLWRARIILPADLTLPPEELRMVLLHELAHVRRGDLWVTWLAWIAGSLHWFNPAIWFALARARKDREMACDESVLRFVPDFNAYGSALVRFLESRQKPLLPLGGIGIFESKSALLERVRRIAAYRRPTLLGSLVGAALLILVGLLTLTGARAKTDAAPDISAEAADQAWPIEHSKEPLVIRCEDEDGRPVPSAEVYLLQWHGNVQPYQDDSVIPVTPTGPLLTDAHGEAAFPHPITFDHGDYRRNIFTRVPGKLVGAWWGFGRDDRALGIDRTGKPLVVSMLPSVPVRGRVQFATGADPRKATVSLLDWWIGDADISNQFGALRRPDHAEPWPQWVERTPDRQGWFRFEDVPGKGFVTLAADAPGSAEIQYATPLNSREPFTMRMDPESAITGRATIAPSGKPAAGVRVYAHPKTLGNLTVLHDFPATAGNDGTFRIAGLPAGYYAVSADHPVDCAVEPQNVSVGPDFTGTANIVIEPGAVVAGKLTEQKSHAPVSGITIIAGTGDTNGEQFDSAVTDQKGGYRLRLPSGKSLLSLTDVDTNLFRFPRNAGGRIVTVADGHVTDGALDFTISRNPSPASPSASPPGPPLLDAVARGRVVDLQGKPVPHALITYSYKPLAPRSDGEGGEFGGLLDFTNEVGAYEVKLLPNCDYQILAGAPGTSTAHSLHFNTGSGTSHQVEDLVVRPASDSAAGVIVDGNGQPVADVEVIASSKDKYLGFGGDKIRTDAAGRFRVSHLLGDELFDLSLNKPGYLGRDVYAIPPGVTDLRILLLRAPDGPPAPKDYGHWLRSGKRLIGAPAPPWDVEDWIQKEDPVPNPKRSDGRWTLLVFERGEDGSGEDLRQLADVAARLNLAPVMIYQSHFDRHLPRWILQKNPLPVTVGLDRFTADTTYDPVGSEHSATRVAYGDSNAYLIDPNGIVRATPNNELQGIEQVIANTHSSGKE